MTFLKKISIYFISCCCLFLGSNLHAQENNLKSPWIVGLDLGVNLFLECSSCNEQTSITSTYTNGIFLHYRIKKWLGVSANTNYYRQQNYSSISLFDDDTNTNIFTQRDIRFNFGTFSIGPKLILRIGQGDLGLETRFGGVMKSARTTALSSEGNIYDIKYKAKFSSFTNLRIDYTYWPKSNFGITVGFESAVDQSRNTSAFALEAFSPKTPLEDSYPNEKASLLAQLAPLSNGSNWVNFIMGISYRFK